MTRTAPLYQMELRDSIERTAHPFMSMQSNIFARIYFSVLPCLAVADIALLFVLPAYRNMLGQIDGRGHTNYLLRFAPPILIGLGYFILRRQVLPPTRQARSLLRIHAWFYSLIGLAMCVPWVGPFFAVLSPIAPVYLGAVLWSSHGYVTGVVTTVLFLGLNYAAIPKLMADVKPGLRSD